MCRGRHRRLQHRVRGPLGDAHREAQFVQLRVEKPAHQDLGVEHDRLGGIGKVDVDQRGSVRRCALMFGSMRRGAPLISVRAAST